MNRCRSLLALLGLVCAMGLSFGATPAAAKTPAFVITGGDLGEHAMFFWGTDGEGRDFSPGPGQNAKVTRGPDVPPAGGYELYPAAGLVDSVARQLGAPPFRYYPAERLLWAAPGGPGPARWWSLDDETVRFLNDRIAEARSLDAAGRLAPDPVTAHLQAAGFDKAAYTFTPYASARLMFALSGKESTSFAMVHLADSLRGKIAGVAEGNADYSITVAGSQNGGGWGGPLGYYAAPRDGQPGRLWMEPPSQGTPRVYFVTTPGFDAFVAEAAKNAASVPATQAASNRPASVSTVTGHAETALPARAEVGDDGWPRWAIGAGGVAAVVAAGGAAWLLVARRRRTG